MGVAERREREREQLRTQIVDTARDLLVEQGLSGLSMRAIAERIEYSAAAIYLYFRDKDELVSAVVHTGFERLGGVMRAELARVGETAGAAEQYGAMGRAYARFAVENPAYFRVMFELPASAELECGEPECGEWGGFDAAVALVQEAVTSGEFGELDASRTAVIGWGVIHGLTTLYLSGHLREQAPTVESFYALIDYAMSSIYRGWRQDEAGKGEG